MADGHPTRIPPSGLVDARDQRDRARRRQRLIDSLSAACLAAGAGVSVLRLEAHIPRVLERCQTCTQIAVLAGRAPSSAWWATWLVRVDAGTRTLATLECDRHVRTGLEHALAQRAAERARTHQLELFDLAGEPATTHPTFDLEDDDGRFVCVWCGATSTEPQRDHARTCAKRPVLEAVGGRRA